MFIKKIKSLGAVFVLSMLPVVAQNFTEKKLKIVCYNVENYFDCVDDPLTTDEEYLPNGLRGWNLTKYRAKQANIGKVLAAIGGWNAPAIVGLCEIESEKSLIDLTRYSGLKSFDYQFVHYESPDARGVDVALLYQKTLFKPFHSKPIRIDAFKTRDVLLVSGVMAKTDTLHIFVCHFPSRLGGELESEERRLLVAQMVKNQVDSIFQNYKNPNIIIMGDFNDYPDNNSAAAILQAKNPLEKILKTELYNLALPLHNVGTGTYKHDGQWGMLDQFIISGNLLDENQHFFTKANAAQVFAPDFLLETDETNLGKKPFRTYTGMKYNGGFSDHLPLAVDFWLKE